MVFLNFQIGIGFFWFFWFFLVFFWFFLALVLARIRNWKLVFFGFFLFFLAFFGFFGIGLGQHSKLETGFLGSIGFFWDFLVFLVFKFRVRISYQKKPKKTKKKPVATPKLVNWLGFFGFFWFFWGEHPPTIFPLLIIQFCVPGVLVFVCMLLQMFHI